MMMTMTTEYSAFQINEHWRLGRLQQQTTNSSSDSDDSDSSSSSDDDDGDEDDCVIEQKPTLINGYSILSKSY